MKKNVVFYNNRRLNHIMAKILKVKYGKNGVMVFYEKCSNETYLRVEI